MVGNPTTSQVEPAALDGEVLDECFGPVLVIVRYRSEDELFDLLDRVGPALTASIHADADDMPFARRLIDTFADSGRTRCVERISDGCRGRVGDASRRSLSGDYRCTPYIGRCELDPALAAPGRLPGRARALLPAELVDAPALQHRVPRRVDGHLKPPRQDAHRKIIRYADDGEARIGVIGDDGRRGHCQCDHSPN